MHRFVITFVTVCTFIATMPVSLGAAPGWKPDKPVEIVVGVAPGGALDLHARMMQKIWQPQIGVPIAIINKTGAGSAVAWAYLNQHAGDAHFLSLTSPTLVSNAITGANALTYTDVTPIAQLVNEYIVFSVRADSPLKTAHALVERLKKDPGGVSFGLATSLGNPNHVAIGLLARAIGVDAKKLRIVVFNASPLALSAALGGHLDVVVSNASAPLPLVASGKIRLLAITAPHRLKGAYAAVPTWQEEGLSVISGFWRGVIGPRGLKPEQVTYWEEMLSKLTASPEWKEDLQKRQLESTFMNSRDSQKFLKEQYEEYHAILKELGLARH